MKIVKLFPDSSETDQETEETENYIFNGLKGKRFLAISYDPIQKGWVFQYSNMSEEELICSMEQVKLRILMDKM